MPKMEGRKPEVGDVCWHVKPGDTVPTEARIVEIRWLGEIGKRNEFARLDFDRKPEIFWCRLDWMVWSAEKGAWLSCAAQKYEIRMTNMSASVEA